MFAVKNTQDGMHDMLAYGQDQSGISLSTWVEHWVTEALVRAVKPDAAMSDYRALNARYMAVLNQQRGSNQAYALRELGDESLVLAGMLIPKPEGDHYDMAVWAGPNAYASCARLNPDWEAAEEVADVFPKVIFVLHAGRGYQTALRKE